MCEKAAFVEVLRTIRSQLRHFGLVQRRIAVRVEIRRGHSGEKRIERPIDPQLYHLTIIEHSLDKRVDPDMWMSLGSRWQINE